MTFRQVNTLDNLYDEKLIKQITELVVKEIEKKGLLLKSQHLNKALKGNNPKEVVIGVGPSFQTEINRTINGLDLKSVIKQIISGIEEEGMVSRVIKVIKTSDCSFIGKEAAILSGSGIGIGLQSKGTSVIHQKDLYPLTNLELFPQAPLLTLDIYRRIGKNAARYAKGENVIPIETYNDSMTRPKYQVKAALMHIIETDHVNRNADSIEWSVE